MRTPRLLLQRALAQRGTLLTLLVLTATMAGILAGTIGYTRAAGVATVRSTLTEAAPQDAGVQAQTRLAADPDAQDAAVRATVAALLGQQTAVSRALWTEPVSAQVAGQETRVVLAEPPADGITVAGEAPGTGEVLAPAQAGLAPGAELNVAGTRLTVTGTWQTTDERAWFGAPLPADSSAVGPLLTGAATITELVDAPFVRWTGYPAPAALTVADLPGLAAGLAELDFALGDDDAVAVRGLTVTGGLAETVADLQETTSTASAVGLVPVALLGVVCLVALVQVARLLGQTRAREIEILVARGAAPRQLTVWSGVEITVVAALGAGLGTALATAVVGRLDGGADQRGVVLAVGVVVALGTVLAGTVVAGLQARSIARRRLADRSGRLRGAAAAGALVLTGAAAVLSAWQLLRHGTPLIADGGADVLAVVSLGAVLAALAVLALALLGPLTRLAALLRERDRGLVGVLAARQVSRRVRAYAVPLVLVVLAVGATTVASSFAGATAVQREHVAALDTGADVRVTVPVGGTSRLAQPQSVSAVPYREIAGVRAAGVVLRGPGTFGELPVAVTALDTARAAEVMQVPDALEVDEAARQLAGSAPGITLPAGGERLELTVRAHLGYPEGALAEAEELAAVSRASLIEQGFTEDEADQHLAEQRARQLEGDFALETVLWVADADGAISMLQAAPLPADPAGNDALAGPDPTEHTLSVTLPTAGEYQLIAVDLVLDGPPIGSDVSYEVSAVSVDGQDAALPDEPWHPVDALGQPDLEPFGTLGVQGTLGGPGRPTGAELRLMPEPVPDAVPAVITEHLATSADLAVGDAATVTLSGTGLDLTVSGVAGALPGGLEEDAVLLDLAALGRYVLGTDPDPLIPGQVWLTLADDADDAVVAAAAAELAGPEATVQRAGDAAPDAAAPVRQTFWIAAGGAALLALTGIAAVVLALARERRSEVMVLRALGLPAAGQARTRVSELLGVGVLGVMLGVVAGGAAAALLVPTLARAAAPQSSPLPLGGYLDPLPALGLLAVLLAGLLGVAAVLGGRVRSQALDAEYREEVR